MRGPLTANDRSLNVVLVGGMSSFIMSDDDLRPPETGPAVADPVTVISQVGWCTPVEALMDQNCHLKQNPLPDR